jgi:hypothetical protein
MEGETETPVEPVQTTEETVAEPVQNEGTETSEATDESENTADKEEAASETSE